MKQQLFYIFAFISTVVFSQVNVATDTTYIRIGEQFQYQISIEGTQNVIIPRLEKLQGLEIVSENPIDTLKNRLLKKYILTGFDSGAFYIPQQQIFIKNQAYLSDSLLINVATIQTDTTKIKKFAIKGIKREALIFDDYKNYIFWFLGVLFTIIIVLYFALKQKSSSVSKTVSQALPPYQEALHSLSLLDKKLLWQSNKIKEYYSELTGIVRHYIERELKITALEKTTEELIEDLQKLHKEKTIVTETSTIEELKKLLKEADLVKFAKSKPLAIQIESDRKTSEFVINNLQPSVHLDETIHIEALKPMVIVQKPQVPKISTLQKALIIIGVVFCLFFFHILFSQVKQVGKNAANVLKTTIENVE